MFALSRGFRAAVVSLFCVQALTGCQNYIFEKFDLDNNVSLSLDGKQRVILATEQGGKTRDRKIVCAEPSPDVMSAFAASGSGNANFSLPGAPSGSGGTGAAGATTGGGGFSAASNEAVASLAMRTQTIQLLRDGYYRLCEAYMNGAIDQHQYNVVLVNINRVMITLLGIDGIAGTRNVAPAAVSASAPRFRSAPAKKGEPAGDTDEAAASGTGIIRTETVHPAGAVQAEAIANIVLATNSQTSFPGLCVSLLASGELRVDNPGQYSVLRSCDYLLNGVVRRNPPPTPRYMVSKNAADAQLGKREDAVNE